MSPSALLTAPRVAPSILAADPARLGAEVDEVLAAGARVIHVDVMDGHFVPPITLGPLVVSALRERVAAADALLDVHLMIAAPERQIGEFARAGADVITVHAEATAHAHRALGAVRDAGCMAGLALNPATPVGIVAETAELVDVVLCMSVNPGWGGQAFIPASLGKLARLRAAAGARPVLEIDGGVDAETAAPCAQAGAGLLVAGSAIFGSGDPGTAYRRLAELVDAAYSSSGEPGRETGPAVAREG
jgi:ribulose-phosphate 3-epimerase